MVYFVSMLGRAEPESYVAHGTDSGTDGLALVAAPVVVVCC